MAASAIYYTVQRIPEGGPSNTEGASESNVTTPAAFTLTGGHYGLTVEASTFGTVTLEKLGPDGTTYIACDTSFSANGYHDKYLPAGTYKFVAA